MMPDVAILKTVSGVYVIKQVFSFSWLNRKVLSLDLNRQRVTDENCLWQRMGAENSKTVGAENRKARLEKSVLIQQRNVKFGCK